MSAQPILVFDVNRRMLSEREQQILTWTAQGKTRSEISTIMCISEASVKVYLARACQKLNAVNKAQAVAVACALGAIVPYDASQERSVDRIG